MYGFGLCVKRWPVASPRSALLCCAMPCRACCAMLCHAMPCYAMLCYATLRYATLRYATLCYAMLCYAMLCYAMLCYAMPCYAMPCYAQQADGLVSLLTCAGCMWCQVLSISWLALNRHRKGALQGTWQHMQGFPLT